MSTTEDLSDPDLVARCLGADQAAVAFEALYRRHAPCVRAFLRGFLGGGDEHAVADAVQETFLRAYRALPRFDASRELRPWLLTIAARLALDADARRQRLVVDSDALGGLAVAWPDARSDVRDAVDLLLREASTRVSQRKLQTFLLSRAHGLTHAEVAARVGASVATVKRDLEETTRILSGLAVELDLVPARIVTSDAPAAAWTPPEDGLLTSKQLDDVLREYAAIVSMVRAADVSPPTTPLDARKLNDDLVAAFGFDAYVAEEASWVTGVVMRTVRALAAAEPATCESLRRRHEASLARFEARIGRSELLRDRAQRGLSPDECDEAAQEYARRADELATKVTASSSFIAVATEYHERALAETTDAAESAELRAMFDQTLAMLRSVETRHDAFRQAALDPDHPPVAVLQQLATDVTEARAEAELHRRALAAIARAVATNELDALPPANVALVRARLPEALDAMGPMLFGGDEA